MAVVFVVMAVVSFGTTCYFLSQLRQYERKEQELLTRVAELDRDITGFRCACHQTLTQDLENVEG